MRWSDPSETKVDKTESMWVIWQKKEDSKKWTVFILPNSSHFLHISCTVEFDQWSNKIFTKIWSETYKVEVHTLINNSPWLIICVWQTSHANQFLCFNIWKGLIVLVRLFFSIYGSSFNEVLNIFHQMKRRLQWCCWNMVVKNVYKSALGEWPWWTA